MSWPEITAGGGSGAFGLLLEIEGWPCFFVTHEIITWADSADGRTQVVGLQYAGIQTSERAILHECTLQCGGIKFQIVPQYLKIVGTSTPTDDGIYYLSQEGQPVDQLAASLTYNATGGLSFVGGTTITEGDVIHIGTEAIRFGTEGALTRAIWGTWPQAHPITTYTAGHNVYIYLFPPTMEGRRVTLYAYALGDDMDADGTVVWRGQVAAVPSLESDGKTWAIDCEAVTHVLRQDIAGAIQEAHVIGIHHHRLSPFVVWVKFGGVEYGPFKYSSWDANETSVAGSAGIADFLQDCIVDEAGATTFFSKIEFKITHEGGWGIFLTRSADAEEEFIIKGGSVILGFFDSENDGFVSSTQNVTTSGHTAGAFRANVLDPSEAYFIPLSPPNTVFGGGDLLTGGYVYHGAPVTALGDPRQFIKPRWQRHFQDSSATAIANYPAWRIYVDTDLDGAAAVVITGTNKLGWLFMVADTGTVNGKYYVDIEPTQGVITNGLAAAASYSTVVDFLGYLTGDTRITAIRSYAFGDVGDFIDGLKLIGRDNANRGDAPFITDADLADLNPFIGDNVLALFRSFVFSSKLKLLDVLREDLKFIAHFMRIEADGSIGAVPLPVWTEATSVDASHEFGADDFVLPPFSNAEIGWSPNADGRVTEVELQQVYDHLKKEHADNPILVVDAASIPVTKQRGKSPLKITPYSKPGVVLTESETTAALTEIARRLLAFCGGQYDVITFTAPYTKMGVLVGDIVSVTHPSILAGDGTAGVSGRRGVVIEKRVNLDPANKDRIWFKVLLTGRSMVGYAPSAVPETAVNTSGNVWDLVVPLSGVGAGPYNQLLGSMIGATTQNPLRHFTVGDFIRICLGDTYTPDEYTGVVTGMDLAYDTITVTLDSAWAPALTGDTLDDLWVLEFQIDDVDGELSTTSQKRYAYVASDANALPGGSFARRLS